MKKIIFLSMLCCSSLIYANDVQFNACNTEQKTCYQVSLLNLPQKGSTDSYVGITTVDPEKYKIVAYSFTDAWYTKPWISYPDTLINPDGSFTFTINTGGTEPENASKVFIGIVPKEFNTPILEGLQDIPKNLFLNSLITLEINR